MYESLCLAILVAQDSMIYVGTVSILDSFYELGLPVQFISPHLGKVHSKELGKRKRKRKHRYMKDFTETEPYLDLNIILSPSLIFKVCWCHLKRQRSLLQRVTRIYLLFQFKLIRSSSSVLRIKYPSE